ncbi:MAG: amidohydrolase family protein [Clostridiales Family XIII bacterium]|jgi:N-acyl-D-amino-acid deacylase|nr:amidohydrolase family protein [Clostridiales Family XIII bacterium]
MTHNAQKKYDLVIKGGTVFRFSPDSATIANIGVVGRKIAAVSADPMDGRRIVDATGRCVAPGFIDFHSHVSGKIFSAECVLRQGATTTIGGERNFDGKLIRQISEKGFLINHGFYISQSFTLRRAVGMRDVYRAASASEIAEMNMLAEQFLKNGAFGVHFGLEYVPGTSEAELTGIAEVAKAYDRILLIHMRGDGKTALKHFKEVEKIMRETGVAVHLLHLAYMTGFSGIMPEALSVIRRMRSEGYDITADTGLYAAYPNCVGSSLLKGDWMKRYGREEEIKMMISSGIYTGEFCTEEKFLYLRENFPATLVTVFACDESEIARAVREPYMLISSNAADGPHYENVGHPETAGTFPRLIGRYARDEKHLTPAEAIRKITWGPAQRFRIPDKGNIAEGFDADMVIFNYESIIDKADYVGFGDPNAPPAGIDCVIVNGEIVCRGAEVYGDKKPGSYLQYRETQRGIHT